MPAAAGSTASSSRKSGSSTDHPRGRGEHVGYLRLEGGARDHPSGRAGSTQRQQWMVPVATDHPRAGAGSTRPRLPGRWRRTDHPRGRGEHGSVFKVLSAEAGSSPRTRGPPQLLRRLGEVRRIIPADAGSAGQSLTQHGESPRGRGEHTRSAPNGTRQAGSSPRARGAQGRPGRRGDRVGIIPAGAGSTTRHRTRRPTSTDHPRGRGEHYEMSTGMDRRFGSSPRARGAPPGPDRHPRARRIIPAGAGSTSRQAVDHAPSEDHPRGRGEHDGAPYPPPGDFGSSPRARGARRAVRRGLVDRGIIPAGAGSTSLHLLRSSGSPDHPRGRGEHDFARSVTGSAAGSSPRAREHRVARNRSAG